jgi:signal peptidase I
MNMYQRWRQAVLAAILLVLLAAAWLVLAPIQFGGQAAYVIVDGRSMEPRFHLGDLVIVRRVQSYQINDIVAYNNASLKRYVFHRIIDAADDHFVLKGDNNDWIDSYQPARSELVGRFWVHIPGAGRLVLWSRRPLNMGIMAGVLGTLLAAGLFWRRREKINMNKNSIGEWFRRMRADGFRQVLAGAARLMQRLPGRAKEMVIYKPSEMQRQRGFKQLGGVFEVIFFILGTVLLASLILAYFAFTRPTQHTVEDDTRYRQDGTFSYLAMVPAGIYDSPLAHSGDPLFPRLGCIVNIGFNYQLAGIQPENLTGTYQVAATILDQQSDWHRTIRLTAPSAFKGAQFAVKAPLDLCAVEALVAKVEKAADLHTPFYTLIITPNIKWTGEVAGQKLIDTFEPALTFQFDKSLFFLINNDPKVNPLTPSQPGVIKNFRTEAATLPLFGLELDVARTRLLASLGLIAALIGFALLGGYVGSLARRDHEALMQIKYGPMLVDARDRSLEFAPDMIDIASMDDLAKLAERNNTVILYQRRQPLHFYTVRADKSTYRYAVSAGSSILPPMPLIQLEEDLRRGLERGEFEVHYQPILSLSDGKISGVEALLRWHHPERGLVPAVEFIAAAEATGLINPLGDWLLRVACAQLTDWRKDGHPLTLSVNLSERQLRSDSADSILRVLKNTGMDPHTLQIEIPDANVIEHSQGILPKLQGLRESGVQISVDDSTGNSMLSSLAQLPISAIKLDRPFVQRIDDQEKAVNFRRLIEAARGRGLNVTAVGVETQQQLDFLQSGYCNFAQGYLLGRPATAQELTRSLLGAAPQEDEAPSQNEKVVEAQ